jgi:hypothetical protein
VVSTHIQACMAIIEEFFDQEFPIEEDAWDLLIVGLPNMSEICHCFQTFWGLIADICYTSYIIIQHIKKLDGLAYFQEIVQLHENSYTWPSSFSNLEFKLLPTMGDDHWHEVGMLIYLKVEWFQRYDEFLHIGNLWSYRLSMNTFSPLGSSSFLIHN